MRLVRDYLLVFLWMLLIFAASTDLGAVGNTSRILDPLLRWIRPEMSPETRAQVIFVIRKGAHLTEYAILAVLIWRARRRSLGEGANWVWREFPAIVGVCAVYAMSDELHQHFVSTRQGHLLDVLIDSVGACLGLLLVWVIVRKRERTRTVLQNLTSPSHEDAA
jgi:VanZ family protein